MYLEVIENFLKEEDFLKIKNIVVSKKFPWYFNEEDLETHIDSTRAPFFHVMYAMGNKRSDFFEKIYPYLENSIKEKSLVDINKIIRLRANLQLATNESKPNPKHIDYDFNHNTLILYLNNCDGETLFYKNEKVVKSIYPKENTAIVFDGTIEHSSSTPTKKMGRFVLNLNFF